MQLSSQQVFVCRFTCIKLYFNFKHKIYKIKKVWKIEVRFLSLDPANSQLVNHKKKDELKRHKLLLQWTLSKLNNAENSLTDLIWILQICFGLI